ncbi:hypothetical protein [Arenicella xantha]|uniref:Uncharacterized protein n=1 Tax=Arenicella xantha TaxID=644221 RepID=A0A395JHE7_9GAMM|nr:hypothetical protein [Arenicella xantha]RBP48875.1 hypothetical protein DFR28_105214 [Arenicella xantha]
MTSYWLRRLLLTLCGCVFWGSGVCQSIQTSIIKSDDGGWSITYSASKPVQRIAFSRNPDDSRTRRWRPVDSGFEVRYANGEEFVVRADKQSFSRVTLALTPSYRHLVKDYAPFSPFSDGGMLIHSGRFFACAEVCNDDLNQWAFKLSVPEQDHILLHGGKHLSTVQWVDSNDGTNVYVGQQEPIRSNGFLVMIDAGLPAAIHDSLLTDIPKLTAYFEMKMGAIGAPTAPSLFASYANVPGTSVQGGVLPNQIFIHWNKDNLEQVADNDRFKFDLLWTFAHEVGHYYQDVGSQRIKPGESWIHEGHAEFLAYDALTVLYPAAGSYLKNKVAGFSTECSESLATTSLDHAHENSQFGAYYSCGFLIYQAITRSTPSNSQSVTSVYTVWDLFKAAVRNDNISATAAFMSVITQRVSDTTVESISNLVYADCSTSKCALAPLLKP